MTDLRFHDMFREQAPQEDDLQTVLDYHERTKHSYHRFAASLGYLDWETQPDPFRRFEGAPLIRLRLPSEDRTPLYATVFRKGALKPKAVSPETISEFFFYSLALSAWKQHGGSRWALRVNPSSGNLHPTEGYAALYPLEGLHDRPAVYHYAPKEHALELRAEFSKDVWNELAQGLPPNAFLVGLSSVHWRESWKYGERAYRYCQHDAGHALSALRISAALLGWGLYVLDGVSDEQISRLFGMDRVVEFVPEENENPDLLAVVLPEGTLSNPQTLSLSLPETAVNSVARGRWHGKPNKLSKDHFVWEVIDQVAHACKRSRTTEFPVWDSGSKRAMSSDIGKGNELSAARILRQRRSALALDGVTSIDKEEFFSMLMRVMPDTGAVPWDSIAWAGFVHLGIFVHRVTGLKPGLYFLVRRPEKLDDLKTQMPANFTWMQPPDTPESLPLFLLKEGDVRSLATGVSCGQDIAGDGAFSLGMLAEFEQSLRRYGAHFYRNLFWETGIIGQMLYLEAEALGIRSTGIGCFFDDPVHEAFGLTGRKLQSLYHFTVGGELKDPRLTALPAYYHLERE